MSIDEAFAGLQVEPDWQDVLVRSTRINRRSKRHVTAIVSVVVVLAAIVGPALATTGWLNSIFAGTPVSTGALSPKEIQALETLTTRGVPTPINQIDMPSGRLAALQNAGLTGIRRLGETQGLAFYAFDFRDGHHCYDAVRQDTAKIVGGILKCGGQQNTFPSPTTPIEDLSLVGADVGQTMHTIDLEGVAADGVAAIGVLGSDGNVYGKTEVVGNLYVSKNLSPQADGPIIAFGASGNTIWCADGLGTRFPASVRSAAGCPALPVRTTGRWVNPNRTTTASPVAHG